MASVHRDKLISTDEAQDKRQSVGVFARMMANSKKNEKKKKNTNAKKKNEEAVNRSGKHEVNAFAVIMANAKKATKREDQFDAHAPPAVSSTDDCKLAVKSPVSGAAMSGSRLQGLGVQDSDSEDDTWMNFLPVGDQGVELASLNYGAPLASTPRSRTDENRAANRRYRANRSDAQKAKDRSASRKRKRAPRTPTPGTVNHRKVACPVTGCLRQNDLLSDMSKTRAHVMSLHGDLVKEHPEWWAGWFKEASSFLVSPKKNTTFAPPSVEELQLVLKTRKAQGSIRGLRCHLCTSDKGFSSEHYWVKHLQNAHGLVNATTDDLPEECKMQCPLQCGDGSGPFTRTFCVKRHCEVKHSDVYGLSNPAGKHLWAELFGNAMYPWPKENTKRKKTQKKMRTKKTKQA